MRLIDTTSSGHVRRIEALVDLIKRASIVQEHALQCQGQCISLCLPAMYPPYPVIYSSYSSRLAAKGSLGSALGTVLTY